MPKSPWIKGTSIGGQRSMILTYVKRGNTNFWGSHQKPRICIRLGSHLQWGGLLYSPKKPWRKGAKGRRTPMMASRRRRCPAPPPPCAHTLSLLRHDAACSAISITITSLSIVVHSPTNLCNSPCDHGGYVISYLQIIYRILLCLCSSSLSYG